jgi:hypothetical protein
LTQSVYYQASIDTIWLQCLVERMFLKSFLKVLSIRYEVLSKIWLMIYVFNETIYSEMS